MNKYYLLVLFSIQTICVNAQWNNEGNNYTTGSLGLGKTPGYRLEIIKSPSSDYSTVIRDVLPGNDSHFYHLFSSNYHVIGSGKNGTGVLRKLGFAVGTTNGESAVRMTVDASGNVGIGLNSPEGKLHVLGSGYFGNENMNASHRVAIGASGGNYGSVGHGYKYTTTAYQHTYAVNDFASQLIFESGGFNFLTAPLGTTGSLVPFATVMSIKRNGNVGIGTINPDAKLAVKGTVHAEEVKVDLNVPVPDYVFEKNYSLRPLTEVENYINQNKHLPEVPAAKEMEANGVSLGELNMLLLKKVEELTLYLLEQNQTNQQQAKEIEGLKQQLMRLKQ